MAEHREPLNSKTRRETAVTVALIICGLAPARPPATIVMNSSMFAAAEERVSESQEDQGGRQTIIGCILVHSVHQTPLHYSSLAHFTTHGDDKVKRSCSRFLGRFLCSEHGFRYQRRNQMHGGRWDHGNEQRQKAESVLSFEISSNTNSKSNNDTFLAAGANRSVNSSSLPSTTSGSIVSFLLSNSLVKIL